MNTKLKRYNEAVSLRDTQLRLGLNVCKCVDGNVIVGYQLYNNKFEWIYYSSYANIINIYEEVGHDAFSLTNSVPGHRNYEITHGNKNFKLITWDRSANDAPSGTI